ncbi:MAG: ATP-binding protein, partial [Bacteroidetes bacterium]|nr:ATP-binding protein [Bacteroidota bacterium]
MEDFQRLEEVFFSLSKSNIFLFDEIQNIEGWEIYIRTLLDKNKKVIITGSNATLLSKELGTKLTGRHLKYELFPFSYSEYLHNKNKKPSTVSFLDFFTLGGFPEYLRLKEKMILKELFNDIIARDITVRYNLRNSKLVKEIALYLISNIGKEFSYQNLRKI